MAPHQATERDVGGRQAALDLDEDRSAERLREQVPRVAGDELSARVEVEHLQAVPGVGAHHLGVERRSVGEATERLEGEIGRLAAMSARRALPYHLRLQEWDEAGYVVQEVFKRD